MSTEVVPSGPTIYSKFHVTGHVGHGDETDEPGQHKGVLQGQIVFAVPSAEARHLAPGLLLHG